MSKARRSTSIIGFCVGILDRKDNKYLRTAYNPWIFTYGEGAIYISCYWKIVTDIVEFCRSASGVVPKPRMQSWAHYKKNCGCRGKRQPQRHRTRCHNEPHSSG